MRVWTDQDTAFLKQNLNLGVDELSLLMDRTIPALYGRANLLGLTVHRKKEFYGNPVYPNELDFYIPEYWLDWEQDDFYLLLEAPKGKDEFVKEILTEKQKEYFLIEYSFNFKDE